MFSLPLPETVALFALVKTEFEKAINTHTCTAGYLYSMWHFELGMWISFELLVNSPETLETVASYEIVRSVCSNIIVVICLWEYGTRWPLSKDLCRCPEGKRNDIIHHVWLCVGKVSVTKWFSSMIGLLGGWQYVTHSTDFKCHVQASDMIFHNKQCLCEVNTWYVLTNLKQVFKIAAVIMEDTTLSVKKQTYINKIITCLSICRVPKWLTLLVN